MQALDPQIKKTLDSLPGKWVCKDKNSVYLYVNQAYVDVQRYKSVAAAIGTTDFDMPSAAANCADLFQTQDQEVMTTQKPLKILDVHPHPAGGWYVWLSTKSPLYDPPSKRVVGTIFHAIDITETSTLMLGNLLGKTSLQGAKHALMGQSSYMIGRQHFKMKLTDTESECLFFLLRNKREKDLSNIFNLSKSQVHETIERLKQHFRVQTKAELLDAALAHGFLSVIPERLFTRQLSVILKE